VLAQRFVYRDVLWAALLINLFALAYPIFSMNVYDRVVPNHATETLWVLAIGVVLVLGSDLFIKLLRSTLSTRRAPGSTCRSLPR